MTAERKKLGLYYCLIFYLHSLFTLHHLPQSITSTCLVWDYLT